MCSSSILVQDGKYYPSARNSPAIADNDSFSAIKVRENVFVLQRLVER